MTRADHFLELLDILHSTESLGDILYEKFRSEVNKLETEAQEAIQKMQDKTTQYWMDVAAGTAPQYVTFDNGKTILQLTTIKVENAPSAPIMFMEIGRPHKTW